MSTELVAARTVFTGPEQLALAGLLAGCTGLTREACALCLRQFAVRCHQHYCACSRLAALTQSGSPRRPARSGDSLTG